MTDFLKIQPGQRVLIGIDPGKRTGTCVVDAESNKILALWTTNFWGLYRAFAVPSDGLLQRIIQFHIEQPSLVKALYARHAAELVKYQKKVETRDKIVWDAGGNATEGRLLAEGLRAQGYTVFDVTPDRRTKWTREDLKRFMKWEGVSNQHIRDAAFLVWGVRWKNA